MPRRDPVLPAQQRRALYQGALRKLEQSEWGPKVKRFHQGKPFYSPSEDVPAIFAKLLRRRKWKYMPVTDKLDARGGHWAPPKFEPLTGKRPA